MPFGDWQFYVVTVAAAWGVWAMVRTLAPRRKKGQRVNMTISAQKPHGNKWG